MDQKDYLESFKVILKSFNILMEEKDQKILELREIIKSLEGKNG